MADLPLRNTPAGDASETALPANSESSAALLPSASRRAIASTDEIEDSSMDQSLARVAMESLYLEDTLEQEAALETPEMILKRMLSIRSVVSTGSSFAQRQQGAIGARSMFREIGTGSIGKVFEHPGTIFVYKVPVSGQPDKLWNNYDKHMRVYKSFDSVPYVPDQVEIPRCFWYANPSTESFWGEYLERFPDLPHFPWLPRHVLCIERIFPLPRPIRHALIEKFCPIGAQQSMKNHEANKDCLIRPCFGRLKYGSGSRFFTLRNFKLHANEIKDLDPPTSELCSSMARALAVLHWHTKIDAMDIEFVLGSSPIEEQKVRVDIETEDLRAMALHTSTYEQATHNSPNFTKRVTALWMLDFDDCTDITMDSNGVDMAVKAFMETNFYCPKPNSGNAFIDSLWLLFAERYIQYSDRILKDVLKTPELQALPREFIRKVSSETAARRQGSGSSSYAPGKGDTFGSMRRAGRESSQSSTSSLRQQGNTSLRRVYTPSRGRGSWGGESGGSIRKGS